MLFPRKSSDQNLEIELFIPGDIAKLRNCKLSSIKYRNKNTERDLFDRGAEKLISISVTLTKWHWLASSRLNLVSFMAYYSKD